MNNRDILRKIKKSKLTGRGGACFSTAKKWEMVKKAEGGDLYVNPINKLGAPLLEGPFVDRTLAGGYPAQMAQREARRAEVMRDVPTDEQLKQERRQQVYDRYLADRAFENELARLRREPVDLTVPQVGPRVSNASGGRTPQMQDLMNKIARKYGIK